MNSNCTDTDRAVILLSGGLDSTVSLALSVRTRDVRGALFFDYGQHAARRERDAAKEIASCYGMSFHCIELPWLGALSSSSLIAGKGDPPRLSMSDIESGDGSASRSVWVENRNGIFLNIAGAFAASRECGVVVAGFNREEAETFPDNSEAFLTAVNEAFRLGVGRRVCVESPTVTMSKREIAREGLRLDIPWKLLWSCYRGGDAMCGECESCLRLRRAVKGTPAGSMVAFSSKEPR